VNAPQEEYQPQHQQAGVPKGLAVLRVESDILLTSEALALSLHNDLVPSHEEFRSSKAN